MASYTVSARKYRPADFSSVVGQQHITETLRNAVKNQQIAQSFLFCGPRGIGKTTCARILAKTVNCEAPDESGEACNQCEPCRSFNSSQSFNFYELDAASNNSVEDIRNLVDQVRFPPQSGKYKVYIIDEVHMLSQSAFNAFLKTLEEPPSYAIFILATTEKHKILPTILSRCQIFDFNRVGVKDIAVHLRGICEKEGIEADEDGLFLISQKADGAMRDSLSILDRIISFSGNHITYQHVVDNLNILDYDYFLKMTDSLHGNDLPSALLLLEDIIDKGFDLHNFLNGLCKHLRDLLMFQNQATNKLVELPGNVAESYKEQAGKISQSYLLSGLNILNQFDMNFKTSKNQRLHVELALMKLCHLGDALNFADLQTGEEANGDSAKKKVDKGNSQPPEPEKKTADTGKKNTESPTPASLNIDELKSSLRSRKKQKVQEEETAVKEEQPEKKSANQPIPGSDEIYNAWKDFRSLLQDEKPSLLAALDDNQITFPDKGVMHIYVPSGTTRDMLKDFQNRFIEILRRNTGWDDLTLNIEVAVKQDDQDEEKQDTPRKRYEKMVEKNPLVADLVEKFRLKPDRNT